LPQVLVGAFGMLAAAILWPYSDHNGTFRIVCRHWLNPLFRLWVPQHCEEWDGLG